MDVIRVAQVKIVPKRGDLRGNFARLITVLKQAARHKPDVVVTPEGFLDGYASLVKGMTRKGMLRYAIDPRRSACAREISRWARTNRAWVVFGCARKSGRRACNSAFVFDRNGRLAGTYDKTHLQDHDLVYAPGRALPVFESDFGTFGVMICADRRWPETVRTLALKGARVIFNPTYGMHCDLNRAMMRTRSFESEVVIAFTHPRQALVTDARGAIVTDSADGRRRVVFTDVDLSQVDKVRTAPHSHLKDRRAELYVR